MSEKMYAYLFRLLPPGFRRRYEDEALLLVRDRLRDERGLSNRLRLILDLITDLVGALPQAYRNSYAEVAISASLTPQFDGVPSFQTLEKEPIRRGALATAGVLSATALATFTFVMGLPIVPRSATQNGPISPIESVIKRLNQPISPNSMASVPSGVPEPTSATPNQSETPASARPSNGLSSTAESSRREANQPGLSKRPIRIAHYSGQASPTAIAKPSSLAQSQSELARISARRTSSSSVRFLNPANVAMGISEPWTGSFRAAAGDADVPQWFIFKQDGVNLTGTGGPNLMEQFPIIHGAVAGNSVTFELRAGKARFLYHLRFENGNPRGTVSIRGTVKARSTQVRLESIGNY